MADDATMSKTPPYLHDYDALYQRNPRQASLKWFADARFGLFIHYGLYSLLGRGEWVMFREQIPVAEYAKLKERFTAEGFDAERITDLALDAGMTYITLVTKHCDSFCLWDTKQTDFNSVNSPAGRDLVAELVDACNRKGLGLFLFYEHGFDWRHPHGPAPWDWTLPTVRPAYDPPDPWYAERDQHDFQRYLDYVTGHITELLTNYGPVAGVWLDGAGVPHSGDPAKFRLTELYDLIHRLQPQTLISYKWGVTGAEDFLAPEQHQRERIAVRGNKPLEVCDTLQKKRAAPGGAVWGYWGYAADSDHRTPDDVMAILDDAERNGANLLLNVGPLPDGSIHPADEATLRDVGKRIREKRQAVGESS